MCNICVQNLQNTKKKKKKKKSDINKLTYCFCILEGLILLRFQFPQTIDSRPFHSKSQEEFL